MGTVPERPPRTSHSARQAPGRTDGDGSANAPATPSADVTGTPAGPDVAVHIDHLDVAYGPIEAVRDATVDIQTGTVVAIIGPNGSGKSTLLSTISGLVTPTRGQVLVHGRPPKQGRQRVAHVLQSTVANEALPLTVIETVRMGTYAHTGLHRRLSRQDRQAIDDAVERMQLGGLTNRQLHELSGGQRQRTYVAQGLAQQADVLLLDEPITGLDLITQDTITSVMASERDRGTAVVLTTHDVGTARLADQVVLIATDIVAAGSPESVLTTENLAIAYGGHLHVLDDGSVVLDDPHQHGL